MSEVRILSGEEVQEYLTPDKLIEGMSRLTASNLKLSTRNPEVEALQQGRIEEFRGAFLRTLGHMEKLRDAGDCNVLLQGDEVASMGAAYTFGTTNAEQGARTTYFITRLVTLSGYGGKKYAQKLLQAIERDIQTRDPGAVMVICTQVDKVKDMCAENGYKPIGTEKYFEYKRNSGNHVTDQQIEAQKQTDWCYYEKDPINSADHSGLPSVSLDLQTRYPPPLEGHGPDG